MTAIAIDTLPKSESPTWRRFRESFRRHPTAIAGGVVLLLMILIAIFAPWLGSVDPQAVTPIRRLKPPSAEFWFGSDMLGRDVYSRVLYGARVSLTVGIAVALLSTLVGLAIGLVTGFVRWLDAIVMRIMDGLMAIPAILLAIALVSLSSAGVATVIVAIVVPEIPRVVRLVRSVVLSIREEPYVEAAIAVGTRMPLVLVRHVLPNTIAPLIVQATYIAASAILIEAILSFLGVGIPPQTPTWGNIMAEGRAVFRIFPHNILFPGIFLAFTVLAVNMLGDGLRDVLDPRMSKRL
jgi:peptide/nickel transport system permease protein